MSQIRYPMLRGAIVCLVLVCSTAPSESAASEPSDRDQANAILAWPGLSSTASRRDTPAGRYLLPSDECYLRYRKLASPEAKYFTTVKEAEAAGYIRQPFGIAPLKKYCDVCSPLYEYFWLGSCPRVMFRDRAEAEASGFTRVEAFGSHPLASQVVAIKGGGIYYTPCEAQFPCLVSLAKGSADDKCRGVLRPGRSAILFATEKEARAAGYIALYESLYNEQEE